MGRRLERAWGRGLGVEKNAGMPPRLPAVVSQSQNAIHIRTRRLVPAEQLSKAAISILDGVFA